MQNNKWFFDVFILFAIKEYIWIITQQRIELDVDLLYALNLINKQQMKCYLNYMFRMVV